MTATLFVRRDCPHCQNAERLLAGFPEKMRKEVRVSEINFKNRPPNVTRVPTLITQQGEMLVGENVFAYLKKWRHDASPPHTEAFLSIKDHKFKYVLIILALLLAAYYWYTHQQTLSTLY